MSDPKDALLSSYRFTLPDELIAKHPLPVRSSSRLLVVPPDGPLRHRNFTDVVDELDSGDLLVVNDTSVLPARLFGTKVDTGGKVELLLVRHENASTWIVLMQASKKPKPGARLRFGEGEDGADVLYATVAGSIDDEPGAWRVSFDGDVNAFAAAHGHIPLPPYLARDDDDSDRERYQTVFGDPQKRGSAAAPTAGLHFDDVTLGRLRDKGIQLAKVTLHVGPGTFLPIRAENLDDHVMHMERWWLPHETAVLLTEAHARKKRIIAVGTTSARVLATAGVVDGEVIAGMGTTRAFLRPGARIDAFDGLLTNFHLSESSLLVLAAAVVGRERILAAYDEAIAQRYRFYSYGDASLLWVRR